MAFARLSRSRSKPQGAVKPVPKGKSTRGHYDADARLGFAKQVFQPPTAAVTTAPVIQTKLKVGEPNDRFEQEADRIADQVMATPVHHAVHGVPPGIQRFSGQSNGQLEAASARVSQVLASSGRPLEPSLRQDMERHFGYDFSRVRVHSGTAAEQSARDVNAHAYTVGHNMVFGAGRFAPGMHEGRRLIAHELTHVVQQSGVDGIYAGQVNEKRGLSPIAPATALIQLELGDVNKPNDQVSRKEKDKKAELEFHSALHFNRTFSGFNPTGPPNEGEGFIIWWSVWNTGWKTAPEHTNRLTIYRADLCSGCRNETDEIFRSEMPAPSIVSITQQGKSDYENSLLIGMSLSSGHYDVYVELDVHNEVEEINEDNNSAFMTFVVRPNNESESAITGEEQTIQPKKDVGRASNVGPDVASQISALRGRGQPLTQSLRAFFEPRFGYDFSHVRVHTDEKAQRSARTLNAQAYTVGNDIVFSLGRFDSNTTEGRQLLAHELAHVVQQSEGHAPRAVARQPANTPPQVPKCHTGCAQRWGQDTTCSKWGFQQGVHEREPQFVIEVKSKKLKLIPCCNTWPWSLEDYARRQLGLNGAASCPVQHEREIATISFGEEEVKVLCSDTIPNAMFGETKSASACSKKIKTEVIEMSPKAMQDLSGQVTNALHVKVCYSGSKLDLCPHNGPGKASFPEIEHCLTEGCSPPEGTPKLKDTGWPRR